MACKGSVSFTGIRITSISPSSYDTVLSNIISQITPKEPAPTDGWKSKDQFVDYYTNKVGPSGFTQFYKLDHSQWIKFFGVGDGLRLERILLGNPLVAITMLKYDLSAGLFVPVELLVKELPDGQGTEVVYVLPSSLITAVNKTEELKAAAEALDKKLQELVTLVTA